jgi:predicted DNA-binding transcriptional regulator AlpA|tara:strand:+ start:9309 stop:9554 length:246 start_codon:yes stop_codon:yes gene_type:complete
MKMPRKRSKDEIVENAEYITLDGLAHMLMVSKQSVYKIVNTKERNFPKPFPLMKSEKREKNIWSKEEVKKWLEEQRSEKVT